MIQPNDITNLFDHLKLRPGDEFVAIHKPGGRRDAPSKIFKLTPGDPSNAQYRGTWMLKLYDEESKNSAQVPISAGEFTVLIELLKSSLRTIYGW